LPSGDRAGISYPVETATQVLHRLTCYEPGREWTDPIDDPRVRDDFEPNDLNRLPWFAKRYPPGLPTVPLPRELPTMSGPALAILSGAAGQPARALDLAGLARLLYLSAGVVRTSERATYTHLFRAAGSAGGRFPLELYVAIPDGTPDLPAGVHWYHPVEHAIIQVGPAPRGAGAVTVIVTGIPWRTGWRYRERGYRHVYWDAGTMLSQLLALADSAGLAPRLYTGFPDAAVAALVGADQVHEWPVALVALGAAPAIEASGPVIEASGPAAVAATDAAPLEFPLVTVAQRAGDRERLDQPWDMGAVTALPAGVSAETSVDAVITARGSQRRMNPALGLPLETLRASMTVAMRGISVEHWVAVHDVTGLAPGLYRWPDLSSPVRAGNLREELYRVALDQGLARDAAFVVIAATDVARLSDHGYREAQLAAGLVEGRLHLAAYAVGASATGMTFQDSDIPGLLGDQPDALIFTCVGIPGNTSRPAGPPGSPTPVRRVAPRD
jgi:SagB-type dehydrogenase family enzyme